MHTEEQAKKRECKIGLIASMIIMQAAKEPEQALPFIQCTASECMMWRWQFSDKANSKDYSPSEKARYRYDVGYCGLAGKP